MTTTEPNSEYADVPDMFRRLKTLDERGTAFERQREAIIDRTLPLAEHVARRFHGRGEDHDDLYQAACVGLINAVNRFDPEKGAEFLSFAVPTIMGEVRRHFRDRGWALKVPRRLKDMHSQLAKAGEELVHLNGRPPTPSELAEHLNVNRETVIQATIASSNYSTVSTDTPIGGQDGGRALVADTLGCLDARLAKVVDVETVRPLIAALPDRERTVLMLRFFGDMTQTQIAQHLGISQMHVSRLLNRTLETLRTQALPPQDDSASTSPAPAAQQATQGARMVLTSKGLAAPTPTALAS
jgi:RNA polymerase sigma-B factor